MRDCEIAKQSLSEEKKAVVDYTERLKHSKNRELREALEHALPEEKEHARLFKKAIKSIQYSEKAIKEAKKIRGGE